MDLVPKLTHSLQSVRDRAWDALLFKREQGLLPDGFLAACDAAVFRACVPRLEDLVQRCESANRTATLLLALLQTNPFLANLADPSHMLGALVARPECADTANKILTLLHNFKQRENKTTRDADHQPSYMDWRRGRTATIHSSPSNEKRAMPSRNHTRSRSPVKLPTFLYPPPSVARFPVIPNAIQSYNYIHLSPVDESAVTDFLLFIQQPADNNDTEQKIFHVLLNDFGSQIFLQNPALFRTLLAGLDSPTSSPTRVSQYHTYISNLIPHWSRVFRKFIDGPATLSSHTPATTTPNASVIEPTDLGADALGLSIPYACHEIWFTLCRLMSEGAAPVSGSLKVLVQMVPFVMMHLETVRQWCGAVEREGNGGIPSIDEFCFDYVAALVPAVCFVASSSEISEVEEKAAWKEKIVELVAELVPAFDMVANDIHSLHWKIMSTLLNLPTATQFPQTLIHHLLPSLNFNSSIAILSVLNHSHVRVRNSGYTQLVFELESTQDRSAGLLSVLANPVLQYMVTKAAVREEDEEIRNLATRVARFGLSESTSSRFWIDWIQCFSDEDELKWLLESDEWLPMDLSFWIKGMFHRSPRIREFSFHELRERYSHLCTDDAFCDALVFNQSILSMNPEQNEAGNMYEGRVGALDLALLVSELGKSENPDLDVVMSGLERLATSIYDSSMLARAKELHVLELLLNCLIESRDWFDRGRGLLNLVKVCRVLVSMDMESVVQGVTEDHLVRIVRAEYLFHANEFIRYEFAKLLFLLVFNHHLLLPHAPHRAALGVADFSGIVYLFETVPQKYFVYPTNEVVSVKALDSVARAEEVGEAVADMFQGYIGFKNRDNGASPNAIRAWTDLLFSQLKESKSHDQFQSALDHAFDSLVFEQDYSELVKYPLDELLGRFLVTHPANFADEQLLINIIRHVTRGISDSHELYTSLKELLFRSLSALILPILTNAIHVKSAPYDVNAIAGELIVLVKTILHCASEKDMQHILTTTECLHIITLFTYHIFALECKEVNRNIGQMSCLECLERVSVFVEWTTAVSRSVGTAFVELLVSVLGFCQQNHADRKVFTYSDRNIYRLAARSLRNAARGCVVFRTDSRNWLWGDHWLFDRDIEWLLKLLNDDERIIQKYGLGILGNLILLKNSTTRLNAKIPQFLDMAFLYVLDSDRNYTLRKESLLIINNYLISYCHDTNIHKHPLLAPSDEHLPETEPPVTTEGVPLTQVHPVHHLASPVPRPTRHTAPVLVLQMFERSGFFEHIRALITDCNKFTIIYMDALTRLFLNLGILYPRVVFDKMGDVDGWSVLFRFLGSTYLKEDEEDEACSSVGTAGVSSLGVRGGGVRGLLVRFRKTQFNQCYRGFMESARCNILNLVRVTIAEKEGVAVVPPEFDNANDMGVEEDRGTNTVLLHFLENTSLLDHLTGLVDDALSRVGNKESPLSFETIAIVFQILSHVLQMCMEGVEVVNLCEWLERGETGVKILELCRVAFGGVGVGPSGLDGLEGGVEANGFRKVACLLLSQLLVLHYSETVVVNMEQYLSAQCERDPDTTIGESLTSLLLVMVRDALEEMDMVYLDALRGCLEALLSRFEPAKKYAIRKGVIELFCLRIESILRGSKHGKVNDKQRTALHFYFCLLRFIFAGSLEAKEIGYEQHILKSLNESLHLGELSELFMLETILCLQNVIANCHHPAALLERHRKPNSSLVDVIRRIMKECIHSDDVFLSSLNVLKIMVLQHEIRITLVKTSFLGDCLQIATRLAKERDAAKVVHVLVLLRNFTFTTDGQIHAIKSKGTIPFAGVFG
ncbi:hypothetical protein HDU98_008192 [Podochytrium sp. JEL0797]|nr:hypothetical protein HDU98_008192 [Podochytrium sp. JEL0797]